jgi:phosphohistidine phosphatase
VNLYIIRHAEAVPLTAGGVNDDADRPLTERGHAQSRAVAAMLRRHNVPLDVILTSPLLRSRQTAQGVHDHGSEPRPAIQVCDELAPDVRPKKLARALRKLGGKTNVALVGHMPDLAVHLAWLIGGKRAQLGLDKAGVACVASPDPPDKGTGKLVWLVTPDWFMQ